MGTFNTYRICSVGSSSNVSRGTQSCLLSGPREHSGSIFTRVSRALSSSAFQWPWRSHVCFHIYKDRSKYSAKEIDKTLRVHMGDDWTKFTTVLRNLIGDEAYNCGCQDRRKLCGNKNASLKLTVGKVGLTSKHHPSQNSSTPTVHRLVRETGRNSLQLWPSLSIPSCLLAILFFLLSHQTLCFQIYLWYTLTFIPKQLYWL